MQGQRNAPGKGRTLIHNQSPNSTPPQSLGPSTSETTTPTLHELHWHTPNPFLSLLKSYSCSSNISTNHASEPSSSTFITPWHTTRSGPRHHYHHLLHTPNPFLCRLSCPHSLLTYHILYLLVPLYPLPTSPFTFQTLYLPYPLPTRPFTYHTLYPSDSLPTSLFTY